jgi:hypothetical protein
MVYTPPDALGWQPVARSWLEALPLKAHVQATDPARTDSGNPAKPSDPGVSSAAVGAVDEVAAQGPAGAAVAACAAASLEEPALQPVQEFLWGLLDAFFDPMLRWSCNHGRQVVATADVALTHAALTLLTQLLVGRG